jgi:hypothetical protein
MLAGYGADGDKWVGQVVRYRRGVTTVGGRPAPTIEIVPPNEIVSQDIPVRDD